MRLISHMVDQITVCGRLNETDLPHGGSDHSVQSVAG